MAIVRWLVPAALALVLAVAATAGGSKLTVKPGKLTFNSTMGSVLPTRAGKSIVSVLCDGAAKSLCRGSVRLLPRGDTLQRLGPAAVASRSFRLKEGDDGDLTLRLTQGARSELAHHNLAVAIQLRSGGKSARRAATVAVEKPFYGHKAPTSVHVNHPKGVAAIVSKTYTWTWTIKAGSYLVIPDFRCPGEAPRVAAGRKFDLEGYQDVEGLIEASASSGTGYSAFDHAHVTEDPGGGYNDWAWMYGWPEGGWRYNSAWAPVFEKGHFELKVTCTSDKKNYARVFLRKPENFFPWKN